MLKSSFNRVLGGVVGGLVAIMIVALPLTIMPVLADCVPPSGGTGVQQPVGADAGTYTYNCVTGLWENAHYSFDPATGIYTPKDPTVYTYNPTTGQYDSGTWIYSAPKGTYFFSPFSVNDPPAGATVVGGPNSLAINNTGNGSNNTINDSGGTTNGSSINNTGNNSNNVVNGSGNNNVTSNATSSSNLNNQIKATAGSGNALVFGNTAAGNATSGNTQDMANIVNLLQSSSNALSGNTVTFVANINGDVNGNFMLDPSVLASIQPASPAGNNHLTLNNQANANINNTIDLTASSGNASVADNTSGGNATSGTAKTIANVVNMIDSAILAGKSFIGTININGNFNGNILVPPDFVQQLIADNIPTVTITKTGAGSNNAITANTNSNDITANNTNNLGINNNITADAASGNAGVANNTAAGSATSGNASNSITAFNLTGSNVVGCNAILVFVNVVGKWVGLIVNAPPGSTAAALGGCLRQGSESGGNTTANITSHSNLGITNNIKDNARSGDASVTSNTKAGNARSGDAENVINLLNIENSSLSFSGWFGILFINVFGTWNGNFGIDTASASNSIIIPGTIGGPTSLVTFIPTSGSVGGNGNSNGSSGGFGGPSGTISNTGNGSINNVVLAARTLHPGVSTHPLPTHFNWLWAGLGSTAFILFVIGDRIYSYRPQLFRR